MASRGLKIAYSPKTIKYAPHRSHLSCPTRVLSKAFFSIDGPKVQLSSPSWVTGCEWEGQINESLYDERI